MGGPQGAVWLTYNDATWLAERHDIAPSPSVTAIEKGLEQLVGKAVG